MFDAIHRRIIVDAPTPLVKQAPIAIIFALTLLVAVNVDEVVVTSPLALVTSAVLMAGATVLAAIFSTRESLARFGPIVPALDFYVIGWLCLGTDASNSIFRMLVVLPVVWFAAEPTRWSVLWAGLGAATTLLLPYSWLGISLTAVGGRMVVGHDFSRDVYGTLMVTFAAAVINEVSRQSRSRLKSVKSLAEEREAMLEHSIDYARELRKSEEKLRTAERLFRGLWESITEQAVIGTDITGLIEAWNPGAERMLGVSAHDTEDKRHMDSFHLAAELEARARELHYPAGATVLNPGFSALVESARLGQAEVRDWNYVRGDGTLVPVELSVTPRRDANGAVIGYLFVAQDVTKAREVARLKDEFVGLISHELRTPLSSILGYLELMRDDEDEPLSDAQLQYLSVAERNAHRLLRLVGDLLFTAQVESGKFNLDAHEQGLAPIVRASVESARPAATAAGIVLVTKIASGSQFYVDGIRIGQACDNLISNAIKFTPRGGTVTVQLEETDSDSVITVRDTGMGIPAAELDQLFGRFFRASTATRNAVPGVGLGLTITKAIVTAHLGRLDVDSEEGVGTGFSVTLPLTAREALALA